MHTSLFSKQHDSHYTKTLHILTLFLEMATTLL